MFDPNHALSVDGDHWKNETSHVDVLRRSWKVINRLPSLLWTVADLLVLACLACNGVMFNSLQGVCRR